MSVIVESGHKQVLVYYGSNAEWIFVDEGLMTLLIAMWQKGIDTLFSCEGFINYKDQNCWSAREDRAYILMRNSVLARVFVHQVFLEFSSFKKSSLEISTDYHRELGSRILIRFPPKDIPRLKLILKGCLP